MTFRSLMNHLLIISYTRHCRGDGEIVSLTGGKCGNPASDSEGTLNTVMEAMPSGLPIVATTVGGVPEVVENGDINFQAEAGRVFALREYLRRLLTNSSLRMEVSRRARAFVEARRSLDALSAHLEALYRRILQSDRSAASAVEVTFL